MREPRVPSAVSRALVRDLAQQPVNPTSHLDDDAERRARAVAWLIVRRAGVSPLLSAIAALTVLVPADTAQAQSVSPASSTPAIRAAALGTARVRILAAPVRLSDGQLHIDGDARSLRQTQPYPPPRLRPCDIARPDCRMIVYDLP